MRAKNSPAKGRTRQTQLPQKRGAEQWLRAGQVILAESGIGGLRLTRLAESVGKTTGSFYHFFHDMDSYLGELTEFYSSKSLQDLIDVAKQGSDDPLRRLERIGEASAQSRIWNVTSAMIFWGATDKRAANAVASGERLVLDFLIETFGLLGFDPEQAELRAKMLLVMNFSNVSSSSIPKDRAFRQASFKFLTSKK
tara:strand:+ start:2003 stop:2590 length:588 start_codon:yes stop_codon:yes gene_type:complete